MKKLNLYVTEWSPNGTNDLLVCNESHELLSVVEEATFGINVMEYRSKVNDLVADHQGNVLSIKRNAPIPEDWTYVRAITVEQLKQKLCVSPVDPNAQKLIQRLVKAGIKLEGAK